MNEAEGTDGVDLENTAELGHRILGNSLALIGDTGNIAKNIYGTKSLYAGIYSSLTCSSLVTFGRSNNIASLWETKIGQQKLQVLLA